ENRSTMSGSTIPAASSSRSRSDMRRRLPLGADYQGDGRTHVRVWAPAATGFEVVVGDRSTRLDPEQNGYFSQTVDESSGTRYWLRRDGTDQLLPDPASRFQPDGPHGASEVIDPASFHWSDHQWRGLTLDDDHVIYELHVGTFTLAGT